MGSGRRKYTSLRPCFLFLPNSKKALSILKCTKRHMRRGVRFDHLLKKPFQITNSGAFAACLLKACHYNVSFIQRHIKLIITCNNNKYKSFDFLRFETSGLDFNDGLPPDKIRGNHWFSRITCSSQVFSSFWIFPGCCAFHSKEVIGYPVSSRLSRGSRGVRTPRDSLIYACRVVRGRRRKGVAILLALRQTHSF